MIDLIEREVPIVGLVFITNPEARESLRDVLELIKMIREDPETRDLNVGLSKARLIDIDEQETIVIMKNSIIMEIHYEDRVTQYTVLENTSKMADG